VKKVSAGIGFGVLHLNYFGALTKSKIMEIQNNLQVHVNCVRT